MKLQSPLSLFFASACRVTLALQSDFDAREATISSVHHSLYAGLSTCRDVVSAFLSRIEALNNHTNAIISLNPDALSVADECDTKLKASNGSFGPLFCVPVLLKDNYDTANMPTTGGNLDLANSRPSIDAPVVTKMKEAGAIILGKTNLHELALEGLSVSSLGGQTINPYDFTRTPGGSSGGTGAAIAASFAVWGTGTDTVNSLRSPASANSLFSFRPTRGLISRAGIIPISYTQDAIGAIGRCVKDIATAMTIMASVGFDSGDNTTALIPPASRNVDYTAAITTGSLRGLRLGLIEGFFNRTATNETTPVNQAMAATVARLERAGASVIPVTDSFYNATAISADFDVQQYEYRQEMDTYLQRPSLKGEHPTTLNQLYASGKFLVVPSQYGYVETSLISSTSNQTWETHPSYDAAKYGIQNLTLALFQTFAELELDAFIYPEQKNLVVKIGSPSQSGRNGILAAVTGSPVVVVPVGFSPATNTAPEGVPIGMEILGLPWTEEKLLQIAYQFESLGRVRKTPNWAQQAVDTRDFKSVPSVTPDRLNIPSEYPVGVL